MRIRKYSRFVWLFMVVIILSACNVSASNGVVKKNENGDYKVTMTTAGTSGSFYAIGAAISQNLNNNAKGIFITNQASGGSVENVRLLDRNEVNFALVGGDSALAAYNGTHEFEGNARSDVLRGVISLYEQPLTLVVLKDSNIKSFNDLKGKRVAVGAPGSGSELKSKEVLEVLGLPYDEGVKQKYLSFADAIEGMRDNQVDATFVWAGAPASAVQELGSTRDIDIVGFTEEESEKIFEENPSIFPYVLPGGTYKEVENDVRTLAINTQIVTRNDIPDEAVYNFVKGFFENIEEIQLAHSSMKEVSMESAVQNVIEMHPGAKQYFEESGAIK
ncbi:TAXI family TRAP transporter solute-binding subunit [Peribacillus sp. NPDC046944]|uniref:TAXI family TRAP transporter solute-binding subunit n=1 Tax=unclassified Peribacillus TaxID=2675266 RepID=UPI003CFEB421